MKSLAGFSRLAAFAAVLMCLGLSSRLYAVDYPEVEPNDTKAAANIPPAPLNPADSLSGATTGSSTTTPGIGSADYFRISTAPAALGIYRHRLQLTSTGTLNQTGTLRGLTQTGGVINVGTDATAQTASTTASGTLPPRTVQWYGFGKQEELFYRVTGASTSTDYTSTLSTDPVTPVVASATFSPGDITIARAAGSTTDLDFWVYDSNLDVIPNYGRDQPEPATLTRNYGVGTYYIALTNFNFANNQPASSDDTWLTGTALDFANGALNSSTTINLNLSITISDTGGVSETLTLTKTEAFEIIFVQFTVVPATGSCCQGNTVCVETTAAGCAGIGGIYFDGQTCATTTCIGFGACCNGTLCSVQTQSDCLSASGTYKGDGTDCDPNPCIGACCIPSLLECQDLTESACLAAGGGYQGDGSTCATTNCGFCPCTLVVNIYPHYENFESSTNCATTCNPVCSLTSDWTNLTAPDDNAEWAVDENGTPSTPTGPSNPATNSGTTGGLDYDPGTTTGNYAYIESSSCTNRTAILLSPCYDLTVLTSPQFTFAYHMFGADMATASLNVEVSTTACATWDTVFTTSGDQGNVWHTPTISLAAYQSSSSVRIRIRGVTGADFLSDIAIDALLVRETPTSGACCKPDGSCTDEPNEGACLAAGGTFQGLGTNCLTVNCGGACCGTDGLCTDVDSQNACLATGGTFQGYNTNCLDTTCPLVNDDCATATVIASLPFADSPDFTTATHDQDIACNAATNTETRFGVWYTYTPTTDCVARFRETSTNDIALAVFSGGDCNSLVEVHCSGAENSNFAMTANTQYWILIGHASATTVPTVPLDFFLDECIAPIQGDFCSTAKLIDVLPYTDTIDHVPASDDADVSCNSTTVTVQARHGVWYTYTPLANCTAAISETSTNDTVTAVFSGPDCNSLVELQCSDPETSTIAMTAGVQYWIMVGMWSGITVPTVPLTINFNCLEPPPNDDCANAITLACGIPEFGNVDVALVEAAPVPGTCPDTFEGGTNLVQNLRKGLWYKVIGDGQVWTLSTCNTGTNFDTQISVFTGGCAGPVCLVANDDMSPANWNCALSTLRSQVRFTADLGTEYLVLVTPFSTAPAAPANFQLDVTCEPPPPPTGRCCVSTACSIETEANCDALLGEWTLDGNCTGDLVFSDDVLYPIPDNVVGGVNASYAVPAVNVTDVVVEIDFAVEHTWLGDMIATLTYDDGVGGIVSAHIFARVGRGDATPGGGTFGNGSDMNGLYRFSDAFAGNLWTANVSGTGDMPQGDYRASTNNNSGFTTYPDNGTFVDLNTVFGGPRAAGTWTLNVADVASALTGSFKWKLVLNGGGATACSDTACPCPGDVTGDSQLNGLDVPAFTQAVLLGAGDCADVNGDTLVNLGDVDAFVSLLTTGQTCP